MGSPVCIIKSLCHKANTQDVVVVFANLSQEKYRERTANTHLHIVNEAIVVVLDFAELQEIQASCKKTHCRLPEGLADTVRTAVRGCPRGSACPPAHLPVSISPLSAPPRVPHTPPPGASRPQPRRGPRRPGRAGPCPSPVPHRNAAPYRGAAPPCRGR